MVYFGMQNGIQNDEKALRALAADIHAKIGLCPGMDADVMHGAVDDGEAEQNKWLAGLATTTAGQKLMDHLSHIEAAPHLKPSSAFEQASGFRRVLIHALRKKPTCFGLPKKTPKYMAIVNFSGDRMFFYSENPCLIAFLTMGADGVHPATPGVEQILDHAQASRCSVLLCYALPFQGGIESAYWEVRTLTRSEKDGMINDAHLVVNNWDTNASSGTNTLCAESQRTDILDTQETAFAQNMMACNLDVVIEKIEGIDPAQVFDEQNGKLVKMVSMLQNERKKLLSDHKQEIYELKVTHDLDVEKTCELLKISFQKQAKDDDQLNERMQQAEEEVKLFRSALKGKETELQQFKADAMLSEETVKGKRDEMHSKAHELQKELDKLTSQLKAKDKDKDQALAKQAQAHQRMHDSSERKFQTAKSESANQKQSVMDATERARKVEQAFEAVCAEKAALASQLADARKQLRSTEMRKAIACGRAAKLSEMVSQARMAHAKAEENVVLITKRASEAIASTATIQEAAGAAAHESEELQKERDDLAARLHALRIEREELLSTAELSRLAKEEKPNMVDATWNTDYDPRSAEIDELKSEIAKLHETAEEKGKEMDNLKAELGRLRHRKKQPPPASFLPDDHDSKKEAAVGGKSGASAVVGIPASSPSGGGGRVTPQTQVNIMVPASNGGSHGVLSTDIAHDPNGDPMLEGTIQQLNMLTRSLAEVARAGKNHERAARDAYAKLSAYEGMGMPNHMQPAFGYGQQQPYMYGPPQVGMNGNGMGYQ